LTRRGRRVACPDVTNTRISERTPISLDSEGGGAGFPAGVIQGWR
jgi:hypothetical protein